MINLNTNRNKYNWSEIDSWRFEKKLSYMDIIAKHRELYGFSPSRATLSYHYGEGVKNKQQIRQENYRKTYLGKFFHKLNGFKHSKVKIKKSLIKDTYITSEWDRFRDRMKKFKFKKKDGIMHTWTSQDCLNKFWPNGLSECGNKFPYIECYLTGEIINVSDTTTHCDHIDPEGGNGLDNLCFTTRDSNLMKSNLKIEDWIKIAKKIINKHEELK